MQQELSNRENSSNYSTDVRISIIKISRWIKNHFPLAQFLPLGRLA